jgi:HSP20 family molecular chaperone IbpA
MNSTDQFWLEWNNDSTASPRRYWRDMLRNQYKKFPTFPSFETETKFEPAIANVVVLKNETPTEWTFSYAVPGLAKENLEIVFLDSKMTIACKGNDFFAEFTDVILISKEIDANNISATCKNGILTITIIKPLSAIPKKPIKITVG